MTTRPLIVAGLLAALAVPAADAQAARKRVRLTAFSSCAGLIQYARSHAPKVSPPIALRTPVTGGGQEGGGAPRPTAPGAPAPVADGGPGDSSTTNVQEQGVDEPDIVKSDGSRVFAVTAGALHAIDARASTPRLLASLRLPDGWSHELLLHGHRVLAVSRTGDGTVLTEVDVRDATAMRVVHTLTVPGDFVSARLRGATARVVLRSSPPALVLPPPPPVPVPSPPVAVDALRSQAPARLRSRLAGWVPSAVLRTRRTGRVRKRALVSCRGVRHPTRFSGLDILTVLTIDLDRGLPAVDADAIMSAGETVYASAGTLYVATPALDATAIHAFDASRPGSTAYRASGLVPGSLLNQFSLSEHRGVLRAATTAAEEGESVSRVTTLAERSGRLAELGHVGDLGRGERIYAVRFIEDAGYVVTFRQTDPLYTLDLSDPGRPVKRGELKIRGYSAYLHPMAENLLLGVGQDATDQGGILGTQLSLFDVSNLANPVRLHQRTIASGSSSAAEYDHHAFLWWSKTSLAVLPLQSFDRNGEGFVGAVGFRVQRDGGIAEAGRLSHLGPGLAAVERALVVGDRLFTLSEGGIMVGAADTLGAGPWLPLPGAQAR